MALHSMLRIILVRAVHRHRTGVGSIPAGGPIVDDFYLSIYLIEAGVIGPTLLYFSK